jgi:hypothetical protein
MCRLSELNKNVNCILQVYTVHFNEDAKFWWGNLRETDHLEDSGVDGKIILRRIFRNWDEGGHGLDC